MDPSRVSVPLESFVAHLKRQGFDVGVRHYLDLERVLSEFGTTRGPEDLKMLLCPLFAKSAEQQEFFYRAFDDFYPFLGGDAPYRKEPIHEIDGPPPAVEARRWPWLLGGVVVFVALVAWLTPWSKQFRNPAQKNDPGIVHTPPVQQPSATKPPQLPPSPRQTPGSGVRASVNRIPPTRSRIYAWYSTQRVVLGWSAVVGPLVLLAAMELYRFRRRWLVIRGAGGKVPPYRWPIRAVSVRGVYDPAEIAVSGRVLQRRYSGSSVSLDVGATVEASIASLGFPTLRYRTDSRPPEYLILIDRLGLRDHQASLYQHLAAELLRYGLYVETWFYEGDPRLCWNEAGDEATQLEQLQRTKADYRLILIGDGEQLLDPISGDLAYWTGVFSAWNGRSVLTPEPESKWGRTELLLATQFAVFPATVAGLTAAGEYFSIAAPGIGDGRKERGTTGRRNRAEFLGQLREYLGDGVFQWLCACAVYPELHWDLTLAIGALPAMRAGLVAEANLVKLLHLEWFRAGSIPDEVRRTLLTRLDPAIEREVREAIVGLLEASPAPAGTYASYARQFEIAYQRYRREPRDREARLALQRTLKSLPPDEIRRDYAYLDLSEDMPRSALDIVLPRRWASHLYPGGRRWLGMRSLARTAITVIAVASLLVALRAADRARNAQLDRYRAALSQGMNLSVKETGDGIAFEWSTKSAAILAAQSGELRIEEGNVIRSLPLDRNLLNGGSLSFVPSGSSLSAGLMVNDGYGNSVVETARIPRQTAAKPMNSPPPKQPTKQVVKIGGRTFELPVIQRAKSGEEPVLPAPPDVAPQRPSGGAVGQLLEMANVLPSPDPPARGVKLPGMARGKICGVFVGISKYQDRSIPWLQFADADAELASEFYRSARGGAMPPENIVLLLNEHATRAAIDSTFNVSLRKCEAPDNSLVIFIAGQAINQKDIIDPHTGKSVQENPFLLTHDSNIQDVKTAGYPLADLRELLAREALRFGSVQVFLDFNDAASVCGAVGSQQLSQPVQEVFLNRLGQLAILAAAQPLGSAYESVNFGGGHGAFTYSLVSGLNGAAARSGETAIAFAELADYVRAQVRKLTQQQQVPAFCASGEQMVVVDDLQRPGLMLKPAQPLS